MMRVTCAAAVLLVSLLPEASLAQTAPTPVLNHADTHELVAQAARATMLDLAAAKEVEQKIKDPAYKAYAGQVIADDSKMEGSPTVQSHLEAAAKRPQIPSAPQGDPGALSLGGALV